MRRMATNKQLDYINGLGEVAEKEDKIGTYPAKIEISNEGEFDWVPIQEAIGNKSINFENHLFNTGIYLTFYIPRLLEQYGLGESGAVGYITYTLSNSITMPNSVVDFDSLKAWMQSDAFITAINAVGYFIEESLFYNSVAQYTLKSAIDNIKLYNGELKVSTSLSCTRGKGEAIVGASDPITEPILKVVKLEVTPNGGYILTPYLYGQLGNDNKRSAAYITYLDASMGVKFDTLNNWDELPTSDPHNEGKLWLDNGTLKISIG